MIDAILIERLSVSQELTQVIQDVANSSNFSSQKSELSTYQDPLSYKRYWTLNFVADVLNQLGIQPERYTDLVSIAFKDLAENKSRVLSEGGIALSSSGFLISQSKPEWLPKLAQILKTANNLECVLKVISAIQSHCRFYNYDIQQEAIQRKTNDRASTKN